MPDDPYSLTLTPAARRGFARLPLAAATALFEHITGPLVENPQRLGKPLEEPYDDVWTTRRGDYRALYTINEAERTVTIVAVAHRRDAYRAR